MEDRAGQGGLLAARLNSHQLDVMIRQCEHLAILPAVAAGVVGLTAPGAAGGAPQLSRLVASDPALTAKVFLMANASSPHPAATVEEAVARLGPEAVRSAVLAAGPVDGPAPADDNQDEWNLTAFWRHCLATAAAAKMLAEHETVGLDGQEAFLCGLLHDIGKLLLAGTVPKSYARVLAAARLHRGSLVEQEQRILGVDHLVAGLGLARRWRLPRAVQEVIWLHHQPGEAVPPSVGQAGLIHVVRLANALARRKRVGLSGDFSRLESPEEMGARLGVGAGVVGEIGEQLPQIVERRAGALGVERANQQANRRVLLAAANQELGRLNEALRCRGEASRAGAQAFERLARFAGALKCDAAVGDVLVQAAEAFLALADAPAAPGACAAAYSLDEDGGSILAVRCCPGARPEWRSFALADPGVRRPSPRRSPAAETMPGLLAEAGQWQAWMDLSGYVHLPLAWGGQWLGGVLVPAAAVDETCDALAGAVGMALGLVHQRARAVAMSQELASASRQRGEAQEAVAQARMLEAMRDLAAGAAHELNTPLAIVSGRAQLMRNRDASKKRQQAWQTIVDQAQRISDIIAELMEIASPPEPAPSAIAPQELLSAAAEAFSSSDHPQAKAARVDIQIGDDCPAIWADRAQMQAVVVELMTNAATAASAAPHIRLAAQADPIGGSVLLTVRDDGPGMDEDTAARAFTPFFSAQAAGRRRGLGLPRAKRYIEMNRGRIRIDSQPGEGTDVSILLPPARRAGRGNQTDAQR